MEIIRVYVLPGLLVAGAILLLAVETRALQASLAQGSPRWLRFGRRMTGAVLIAVTAFMLHFAEGLPTPDTSPEVVTRQFRYWMWVVGVVCTAMGLAAWDVLDSIRLLKSQIDTVEQDEMNTLKEQLKLRK